MSNRIWVIKLVACSRVPILFCHPIPYGGIPYWGRDHTLYPLPRYPVRGNAISYSLSPYTLWGGGLYPVPLPPIPYQGKCYILSPFPRYPMGWRTIPYPPSPYTLSGGTRYPIPLPPIPYPRHPDRVVDKFQFKYQYLGLKMAHN